MLAGEKPARPARDYYLGVHGSDTNPGTRARPWRSIARVNRARFAPGDRILLRAGEAFTGNLVLDSRSVSTAARPITVGSWGGGRALVEAGEGSGIAVHNIGGVVVRDLVVAGSGGARNRGGGVVVLNDLPGDRKLAFIRIENVEARGFLHAGIYVGGPSGPWSPAHSARGQPGFRDVRISRVVAHDNVYIGIHVGGRWDSGYGNQDVTIADSAAYDNAGDPGYRASHSGNGILLSDTDGGTIERSVAFHNGARNGSRGGGPVGIWAHDANRVTIRSCLSFDNRTPGASDGGGFDFDGGVSNSTLEYNYSSGNDGPGFLVWNYPEAPHALENNTIRYNVSLGDGQRNSYGGIHIGSAGEAVRNIEVHHNTVVRRFPPGGRPKPLWVGGGTTGIHVWNNLLVAAGDAPVIELAGGAVGVVFEGNVYLSAGRPFMVLDHGRAAPDLAALFALARELPGLLGAGATAGCVPDPGALARYWAKVGQTPSSARDPLAALLRSLSIFAQDRALPRSASGGEGSEAR
ncbi:MAG: right-handed parallel beta-helix repeat-containing protein [Acidobacteriia bacterium]|nr:right-handed parallel beta-helix repeat-containing protein [Terriglobia bacterium]